MIKTEDYPLSRVPQDKRVSLFSVAIVYMGALTSLDQFMLGAVLGNSMELADAFIALFIASIIFCVVTYGLGMAGMREGISGSLLARWCGFGRLGSALVGIVVAVSLLGWFGIQNAIFAKSLDFALGHKLGFNWAAILSGSLLTILVAFGFKALRIAARIAVPTFILLVIYITFKILTEHNISDINQLTAAGDTLSISAGITIVMGGAIMASLVTPDLTRYSKNGKHVLGVIFIGIIVGKCAVNGLALLIAKALGTADVVSIMSQTVGVTGLLVVVFSTLKVNDLNLYCSSLGIVNAVEGLTGKKLKYLSTTLVIGALGTTLSVLGILDRFIDFLSLLGVVLPPIIGIMLVDYYVLRSHRKILDKSRDEGKLPDEKQTPVIGWVAIIASIVGSVVGLVIEWGIPTINSLVAASFIYWALKVVVSRNQKRLESEETV
ncbi:permease for cytosine/purine, uracil, thiamine, allantoin family protein [Yersinia rochesterensis]|uniref:Permease for cytosine/purine, uracil, thiamine, allantoin family protein n=1 Tax=Yersinia rochesterensis TaxID=1604335 RepID=A0ABM5SM30_9GAMM|nr:cytosine permease [Yersinia rochesterensis]AIN18707.1 permease for cytosine/purine, uracil, thiamine, allantoin family protein [Yersinia rochesterensis]AJI85475.1 permease for cytosine/purine, uracil, thiamine, allantoin family protein [Yersinia frederiksenii Y225]AJJ35421.1 permease for cytosine/purine, uracil, thiamine, allantoin family protein [Yersinia rochesterensis]CRY62514.1 putative permease [Yersinia kristensenii]